MKAWQSVSFETLYAEPSRNGLMRPKRVRGSGYKMVNMGELFAYTRIRNPNMDLVPMSTREIKQYKLIPGDLLFARQSLVAAGAGKCSIVLETPEITTFESHIIRVRLNKEKVEPLYYYYYFKSPQGNASVQSLVMQVAAAGIRGGELAKLQVPWPDLAVQKKTASILSGYDDLIENNLRRVKILEEMAQTLYREWFVKFRFPGYQKVKMVNSPLGKIPEGWQIKNLFELADVTYGFPFKSSLFNVNREGIAVVRIRDVLDGQSATFTAEDAPDKYIVHEGDFLVGMDGDFHMGFWAGGTAFLVQRVARFRPRGDVGRYGLALALKEPIEHFNKTITGTTVAHLGDNHLRTINVMMPDKKLLKVINDILEPLLDLQLNIRAKNKNLRQTRDLLLPKLISGELDVSELDIKIVNDKLQDQQ